MWQPRTAFLSYQRFQLELDSIIKTKTKKTARAWEEKKNCTRWNRRRIFVILTDTWWINKWMNDGWMSDDVMLSAWQAQWRDKHQATSTLSLLKLILAEKLAMNESAWEENRPYSVRSVLTTSQTVSVKADWGRGTNYIVSYRPKEVCHH